MQSSADDIDSIHFAQVAIALLYLACGGLDEAHNLVTPLSWPLKTDFGGKPVKGSPANAEASYAHALIHRQVDYHTMYILQTSLVF